MIPKSNNLRALATTVFFSADVISFRRAREFLLNFIFHLFNNANAPIPKAAYSNKFDLSVSPVTRSVTGSNMPPSP